MLKVEIDLTSCSSVLLYSCHGCGLLVVGYGRPCLVPDNWFAILYGLCGIYLQRSYPSCYNHCHHSQAKDQTEEVPQSRLPDECSY